MSNIIVGLRHKQKNWHNQWKDPLGVEEAKREKARTIEVPKESDNPVYKFINKWGSHKLLMGKKIYCLTDKKEVLSGHITDVLPPNYLVLRNRGVVKFTDVITIDD